EGDPGAVAERRRAAPADLAAVGAEQAAPGLGQAARHDRDRTPPREQAERPAERQRQAAGAARGLGEQADQLTAGQGIPGGADGLDDLPRAGAAVEGDGPRPAEQQAGEAAPRRAGAGEEADRP